MIPGGVLAVIGASDCERLGTGLIAQPFNTWTSVAYLLAGGWIIARRRRWGLDPSAVVFGPWCRQRRRQHAYHAARRRVAGCDLAARRPGIRRRLAAGKLRPRARAAPGRWAHDAPRAQCSW
jgi:hypothetical protein